MTLVQQNETKNDLPKHQHYIISIMCDYITAILKNNTRVRSAENVVQVKSARYKKENT